MILADNYSFSFKSGRGDWSPKGIEVKLKVIDFQAALGAKDCISAEELKTGKGPALM